MNADFDGSKEVMRMEHGAAYGLSRIQYWRLASVAHACEKFAGIEPSVISDLPNSPGCQLQLFGKKCLFEISVRPDLKQIGLSVLPLDSSEEESIAIFSGSDSAHDFNRMINLILCADGLDGWRSMT